MAQVSLKKVTVEYDLTGSSRNKLFPSLRKKNSGSPVKVALNSVDLSVTDGDVVGLLGKNGSGKTTLLKVISKILRPITGSIEISGNVGSLFTKIPFINPNLSPRENILQYGEFQSLLTPEIKKLTEDVEEFADIGEYFDQPLMFGSQGMRARFQFGLLTAEPRDILAIDEGIGAGDKFFIEKAKKRLGQLYERASIVFIASHSESLLKSLCNRGVIMDNGLLVYNGSCEEAIAKYGETKK